LAITLSKSITAAAIVLLLGLTSGVWAQEEVRPQTLFNRAYRAMVKGDFEQAYQDFSFYADRYEASPARGAALLGAAKAALHTARYDEALKYATTYTETQPGYSSQAIAQLYRGHALAGKYRLHDATDAYTQAYRLAYDRDVRQAVVTVVQRLSYQVDVPEAREIFHLDLPPEMAAPAWTGIGDRMDGAGQRYQAMRYYSTIVDKYPNEPVGTSAKIRKRELEQALAKTVRVGVVLPLSGSLANYGEEMRKGIELAAREYEESTGRQVDLIIEDSEGKPVVATRKCQSILERDPVAMIGPLTSDAAIGCAAAAAARNVPLVVPAASESGLPDLGDEVYCLSPSVESYGKTLGRYTVEGLELCSHLVIAPNDDFGYGVADAYRRAVEAAGGEVWHETYYTPGITDFGPYLRAFKASFLDTLSDTTWFYAPDSTRYDYEEVTVYPDAIFVPGTAEDLVLLLPQIRFYKVAGRLVGSDAFADDDLMLRAGGNLEGAMFASVEALGDGVTEWGKFSSRYSRAYGRNPTRLAALGYDAFGLLAGGLGSQVVTPAGLGAYLKGLESFDGATGQMEFTPSGENGRVPVYYIRDRQISPALR
jgi:branched-chain amino acid transport system permease protein/branched-chain amino acid transport system substrate-binding protein